MQTDNFEFSKEFRDALPIINQINDNGFEAYFVGGAVRDKLLNIPISDVDIATSAFPNELKKIFRRTIDTGLQHGTITILDHDNSFEITTFRTESTYTDFRRPDKVEFVRSLHEDLKRRDFTINALAVKINGEIIDDFNGLSDLEHKLIKAVGNPTERFNEDALRMMRAIRFMSQLNFEIDSDTLSALNSQVALIANVSIERIHVEFIKLMLGKNWNNALKVLNKTRIPNYVNGFNLISDGLINLEKLHHRFESEIDILTAVVWTSNLSEETTKQFLKMFKSSNKQIKEIVARVQLKKIVESNSDIKNWDIFEVGIGFVNGFDNLYSKIYNSSERLEKIRNIEKAIPLRNKNDLAVSGADIIQSLKIQPGPQVGKFLSSALKSVVNANVMNDSDKIIKYIINEEL